MTIDEGYGRLFSPYSSEITREMPLLRQPVMTLAFFARLLREPAHAPPTAIAWVHGTRTLRVGNSLQETRAIMMVTGTPRGPSQRQTRTHEIFAGQRSPGRLTHCTPKWVNMSSCHAALAAPPIPPYRSAIPPALTTPRCTRVERLCALSIASMLGAHGTAVDTGGGTPQRRHP